MGLPEDLSRRGHTVMQRRARWLLRGASIGWLPVLDEWEPITPAQEPLGTMDFGEGRVVAGDPYVTEAASAGLVQRILPGSYAAILAVAQFEEDDTRVAAAMLVHEDREPVVAWTLAHAEGADTEGLRADEFVGYGVDAGPGCFTDPATAVHLTDMLASDAGMLGPMMTRELT